MADKYHLRPIAELFWAKVGMGQGGCWEWLGQRDRFGYGRQQRQGKPLAAHRVAYEVQVGPIQPGLEIDHLCGNRGCVRGEHLEAVTHDENNRRMHARRTGDTK